MNKLYDGEPDESFDPVSPLEMAPTYIQVIINGLCDRSGFDDWWHNLDEETQAEIIGDIQDAVGQ